MSSLRKYQATPKFILSTALNLFRSKKIRTVVVEGVCDRRFLSQWQKKNFEVRYAGEDGKELVEAVYIEAQRGQYAPHDFLYFFADVDYDGVAENGLHFHKKFIYNAYCFDSDDLIFNDLEIFLVNTTALEKVLVNHDVKPEECEEIRKKLRSASRIIGAFRAADILLKKREHLAWSVLNGLKFVDFFDANKIEIDLPKLKSSISNWAARKEWIPDLIEIAEKLLANNGDDWSLCRGHDVTEMISMHIESNGIKGINAQRIETYLRIACEKSDYQCSPMGRKLSKLPIDECFLEFP